MKRVIVLLLTVLICLSCVACTHNQAATPVPVKPTATATPQKEITAAMQTATNMPKPELAPSTAEIHTAETLRLAVNGYNGTVEWASSDPYIASVDKDGVVTGMHKAGVAAITAKAGDASLTCTVTNRIKMRDISAKDLVSKIKIGSNFSALDNIDFSFKKGYDDYENSSSRVFVMFSLYEPGIEGDYSDRGIDMHKGDTVHQAIPLNSLEQCDPSSMLSSAAINMFYHGSGNFDGKMTTTVSNAKITVRGKSYNLDYLNGTNTMTMKADFNQAYSCWSCGASIGYGVDNGLPKVSDLVGGVFEADITIVDIDESNRPDKITYYLTNEEMVGLPKKEMVDALKQAGYDAVRLTVSYTPFTNNNTFIIDPAWLDKVEEAVNWILSNNMYCIMDTHSDYLASSWVGDHWSGAWMLPKYSAYVDERYAMIWKQIAEKFKNYDDTLLFESMNEPGMNYEAYISEGGKPAEFIAVQANRVNALNDVFYSICQNSGGNNPKRFLMYPCIGEIYGYLGYLKLPNSNRIIASVHSYFSKKENGKFTDTFDDKQESYEKVVQKNLNQVAAFVKKTGVPVIIGEFGNTEEIENKERIYQAAYLVDQAAEIGVPCFWWECGVDANKEAVERFGLYDRKSMSWAHADILQAIINAAKNR